MRSSRLLERIRQGHLQNVRFNDLIGLGKGLGFGEVRHRGHHILTHPDIRTPLNLQEVAGAAKPYQVRQFRDLVTRYNLQLGEEP